MTETYDQARTRLYLAHDGPLPELVRDYLRFLEVAESRPPPTPENLWSEIRDLHHSRRPGAAGILRTQRQLRHRWDKGVADWRNILRDRVAKKLEALRDLRAAEYMEKGAGQGAGQDVSVYRPQPGEDTAVPE